MPFVVVEKLTLDEKNWLRSVRGDRLTKVIMLPSLFAALSFILEVCFASFFDSEASYRFSL